MPSRDEIVKLKSTGLSFAEIGRRLGISRQQAWQIATDKPRKPRTKKKPDPSNLDALLTAREAAELLNVHINTVRRWSNSGLLETYCMGTRGDRRFKRRDIDSFLLKSKRSLNSPVDLPEFRDYARLKYPDALDEDLITMIDDLIQRGARR